MVVFEYPNDNTGAYNIKPEEAKAPIPHKFKIKENGEEETTIVVGNILSKSREKKTGIDTWIYQCQSIVNGIERRYELKYIISRCEW